MDVYGSKIPIMAFAENSPYYLNFYVNWLFGKRW
jgi:hypothetical protein